MSISQIFGLMLLLTVLATAGCHISRNQQIEQENNELRYSMKEKQELLERAEARAAQQKETITACQEKIIALEKKAEAAELKSVEIQKELDACRCKLARQESDLEKQTEYVRNFQSQICELKNQLDKISGKPTTMSAPVK
jgi:chromosome segregation ATPase